jgi:hypothetical protein
MSAEANIHNTQYRPEMVKRAAAANETKYVDRGDINRRLPYVSYGKKILFDHPFGLQKADVGHGQQRVESTHWRSSA